MTDDRTCPVCRTDLEHDSISLSDLQYDRWHGTADYTCPICNAELTITEEERRIGLYGGGMYYYAVAKGENS